MKRWLLFAAIFIAGLGVLWWIDRGRRLSTRSAESGLSPDNPSPQIVLTKVQTDDKGHSVSGGAGGLLQVDTFDDSGTGKLLYRITARNSESLGDGIYRLDKLVVRFFVRGTDTLRMELTADTALAQLTFIPSFNVDPAYQMQFDNVVVTQLEGSPFVPLTLRVPHAKGSLAEETFTSADHVDIQGTGIIADGVGLSYTGKNKEVRLERDTHVSLTLENGAPARLSAAGGLTLTSLEQLGEGATRVVARDRAHLTFEGKDPLVLDADEVTLDALVTHTAPRTHVQPTQVSAHGSVRLAPKDGKFFGNDAHLELDADGRPQKARFEGAPRVEIVLRDVDTAQVPGVTNPKSTDLPVEMEGAGPLDVQIAGDARFDFLGPATLTLPSLGMKLTAQEKLSGTRQENSDFGRLDALGNVEANATGATLTSSALSIERKLTADGQVAASLVTRGNTHAVGPLDDGGAFDLTALNGLEYVRLPKSFQVPIAREAELDVTGPNAMHAKAREVRDLDGLTRSLVGIGDVYFKNDKGSATGERVIAHGKDSIEVFGAPSAPAHAKFGQGTLDAQALTFEGDRLRAEGDAKAAVGAQGSEYHLASRWIELQRHPNGAGQDISLESGGDVDAHIADEKRQLDFTADHLHANAFSATPTLKAVENRGLEATGNVVFHVKGDELLDGKGDRLVIEADRSGRLYPAKDLRVQLAGTLPKDNLTFDMSSGVVQFAPQLLSAVDPAIEIQGVDVPIGKASGLPSKVPLHAVAGAMSVDPTSILFTEGVYVGQTATKESTWSLDAQSLVLTGVRTSDPLGGAAHFSVSTVLAWGGFQARFAETILARGATLLLDRDQNRLTLRGNPAEFDIAGWRISTDWLEVDLLTGFWRASKGSAKTLDERSGAFQLKFLSMGPMNGVDSRIEVVREPDFIDLAKQRETRAAWGLFWLNEDRLGRLTAEMMHRPDLGLPEPAEPSPTPAIAKTEFLRKIEALPFLRWVHEAYFEGNIEMIDHGERRLRADSMYVDLADGHGWMRDVILTMAMPFRSGAKHLMLHADSVTISPDGTRRAKKAVATSCEFDQPHYVVTLGDLRMKPRPSSDALKAIAAGRTAGADETDGFDIKSKDNSVRIGQGADIPIPQIEFPMDANYQIPPDSFTIFGLRPFAFGNSAKFGAFFGVSFDSPLGWFSEQVHHLLGQGPELKKGGNTADVKYLNKRGLLVNGKNSIEQPGVYRLVTRLAVVGDNGSDHGLVKVPKDERDTLRAWLRLRGRRWLGSNEWIDLNLTKQSDPGVQAEFFEGDFLRWEERETYLHYRKADGLDYLRGTLEAQLDDHRTEVIEQPSFGFTRARGPITRWWGRDIVYSSDTTTAHLKRVEGDPRFNEFPFADGFGPQEVLRVDSRQRLERPMPLGVLDAKLVPFVEARATAWDRNPVDSKGPTRFALLAGAEASATFWRLYGDGDLHSLTPTIGVHSDLDVEENGGTPAQFDGVEDPLQGRFTEFGLRSRWTKPRDLRKPDTQERFLDIEVREAYADNLGAGRKEGWQPMRVNAQWLSALATIPFAVVHDARYDLDAGGTTYSHSQLDFRPVKPLEIGTGFDSALDLNGARLYNAWSLSARYDFSDKWQFEGRETISTLSGSQLSSGIKLRRMGHDFVVELQYSFTAGEGGGSVSFSLIPMLTWREPGLGLLSSWQAERN